MSYILEALKKAESERARGGVPGLGSTQTPAATYIRYGSSAKPWWLAALALGVVLALLGGVWAWRQSAAETAAVVAAKSTGASTPQAPAAFIPLGSPQTTERTTSSVVVPVVAKVSPLPAVVAPPARPAVSASVSPEPATKVNSAVSSASRSSSGMPLFSELPEAVRRQLPALAISGAIYSDSPAEWTLIVNDRVIGKGSQVAPDLRLEDISATSAVFNFKGQRFRMEH